jgi:3-oxoacyl-[acyl-carrier-protein] synthase-3
MAHPASVDIPNGVRIAGTGVCIPEKVLTNADLEKMVDTSDEWITQRTGIQQRHIAPEGTQTWELATDALKQALKDADIEADDLDLILCATITPDMTCPTTACRVADAIGATPCGAMDLTVACTGFIAGLNTAFNFIRTGLYKHVAVVGVDVLSRVTNYEDRATCILFGDAGAAAIVSASDDAQQTCLYQTLHSDGGKWRELYIPSRPEHLPSGGGAEFTGAFGTLQMNGREIYKFAVNTLQAAIGEAMAQTGLTADEVAMVIPHQSNARILGSARDKLGLGEKLYINIDRFGNTSAASAGICLHELRESGRIKTGDHVIFVALGGGLTWGSSVWRL